MENNPNRKAWDDMTTDERVRALDEWKNPASSGSGEVEDLRRRNVDMQNQIARANRDFEDHASEIARLQGEVDELQEHKARIYTALSKEIAAEKVKVGKLSSIIDEIYYSAYADERLKKYIDRERSETKDSE